MRLLKATFLSFLLAVTFVAAVQATAPNLLNYQGRLEDASGEPVADDVYSLSFAIYDAPTDGLLQWSETQSNVMVTDGFFNILLGSEVPLADSVFAGEERYLEITVGTQLLLPRTQLASVGYAHRISTIDGAKGGELSDSLIIFPSSTSAFNGLSPGDVKATASFIKFSFGIEGGSMAIYEPADSKNGNFVSVKKVEVRADGITIFGETEADTNLQVFPNGDIIGAGQITMGENSSSGLETTVLGFDNAADGDSSTISGGSGNTTIGTSSVIAGGYNNTVSGEGGTVSGGSTNDVSGAYSNIGGGMSNVVMGDYSVVPGGQVNEAVGDHSFAAGYRAKALHNGSFVWADQTEEDFATTAEDQFIVRASGGVGIGTPSPLGLLEVAGMTGDGSVNLPQSAIASPEIFDEPGLASSRTTDELILTQYKSSTELLVGATIDIPAAGYIVIRGGTNLKTYGTSGPNRAYLQIAESPGGTLELPYAVLAGGGDHDSPNRHHYKVMSVERIYFKPAGTYTFNLEGLAHPDNDLDAFSSMQNSYLTATYLPTSYGSVNTIVAAGDAATFDQAVRVETGGSAAGGKSIDTRQYFQVDLRELELKAAQARAEAERAQRLLLEARLRTAGMSVASEGGN